MNSLKKNTSLIFLDKKTLLFSVVKNRQYLYINGYYLLWNYGRISNIFDINTKQWVYEEEKRALAFRYWLKVENPFPLNSKEWNDEVKVRKIDSLKKLQIDVKNYVFYLSVLFNFFKSQAKFNFFISPFLLKLFKEETSYIFDQKDYKENFLKQNSIILKKYDTLKKYIALNKEVFGDSNLFDYNTYIVNYNIMQAEVFPYLYMLPSFTDDLGEVSDSFLKKIRLKYFSLTKVENWFFNLTSGIKEFWLFFKIKFFFFNFSRFLKIIIQNKIRLNYFFQNKINEKLLTDEKYYLLSVNNNIDPDGLAYLGDYNLWEYLFNDNLIDTIDESFFFNEILEYYDLSFFYDIDKKDYTCFSFKNNFNIYDLNLLLIGLSSDFLLFFKFKFNNTSLSFLFLNNNESIFKNKLIALLKEDFFVTKFDAEYVQEVVKNLEFNPSSIRTFLLEKTMSIKGRGLIKLYNSYLLFLKKYFLIYFYFSAKKFINNPFFSFYKQRQKVYDLHKNFSGFSNTSWFYFPYSDTVELDYEKLFNEYLKISVFSDVKNSTNKYFVFRTSSSGFFKYSIDFSFKLSEVTDLAYLKNERSFFTKDFLYVKMLSNLGKINSSLLSNEK